MRNRWTLVSVTLCGLLTATAKGANRDLETFLQAVEAVESKGNPTAVGDGGRSLGAYQLSKAYCEDALHRHLARRDYVSIAFSPGKSRDVVVRYWKRFVPLALERREWQTLARVHNGGPAGAGKRQTLPYWSRVKSEMRRPSFRKDLR
jgi:hypothetical protein